MNDTTVTGIEAFREQLERCHADFVYTVPAQSGCARIRFIGNFNDEPVIWDATVMTLAHGHDATGSQYIDIGQAEGDTRKIAIGLELDKIDEQTVLKTIIMIRKYKRLRTGRHEFGNTSLVR